MPRGRRGLAAARWRHWTRTRTQRFGCALRRAAPPTSRPSLSQAVQDLGDATGTGCPRRRVWSLWTRYACTAFYSHPWAWNEIGFPGPAYPRGYKNLGVDARWSRSRSHDAQTVGERPAAPAVGRPMSDRARPQRVGLAAARRRHARPTTGCARTCAASTTPTRSTSSIVGCGAGGVDHAPAAGPGRLAGRRARRRTVLGPRHRLGQRRGRLAPPLLDRAAGHRRRRSGAARLEQLRPRRRRVDGALRRLHARASTPATSTPTRRDGVGADWPIDYADLQPYYEDIEEELPVAGEHWPWGDPHSYPHRPHPVSRQRGDLPARRRRACGITREGRSGRDRQRPLRQPAALHLPRLLPAGLQGQRQGLAADHAHPGRPRPRRRGARRLAWSPGSRSTSAPAEPPACTTCATAWRTSSAPRMVAIAGYSIETPRLLLNSDLDAVPRRAVQRLRPGRPLPDGAGGPADRRPVRRRGADVQGAAAGGQHRGSSTRPTRTKPYKRGFSIQTVSPLPITWAEHVAAQGHWGAACAST